ncbi:hypothetical protein BH10BAC5_BH10BAC5_17030 [soil metagenome]
MSYSEYNSSKKEINYLNIKLKPSENESKSLKDVFECMITDSDAHRKMRMNDWERFINYYEGKHVPVGFTTNVMDVFNQMNQGGELNSLTKDESGKIFYFNNKIREYVDAEVGEYINAKKTISCTPDYSLKHAQIATKWNRLLNYLNSNIAGIDEDDNEDLWTDYRIPAIIQMIKLGDSCTQTRYNPNRKIKMGGAIEVDTISPYEMLIDPDGRTKRYFKNSKYMIHEKEMRIDTAREFAEQFGITDLQADNQSIKRNSALFFESMQKEYSTWYFIEFRKFYRNDYGYHKYLNYDVPDDVKESMPKVKEEEWVYFQAIYHKQYGCVFFKQNPIKQFSYSWYCNQESDRMLYHISDVEKIGVYNDVLNVLSTRILNNIRDRDKVRMFIHDKLIENVGMDKVNKFLDVGGGLRVGKDTEIDDIRKYVHFQEIPGLPKEAYEFYDKVLGDIEKAGNRTAALDGEYPGQRIAKKTYDRVLEQSRKPTQFKHINIAWAATQETKLMYKIAATYYTEEHFIRQMDENPGAKGYAPMNAIWEMPAYMKFLENKKTTPQKFEETNDVTYLRGAIPGNLSIPPEVILQKMRVVINPLKEDGKIVPKCGFDWDYEKNNEYNRESILFLFADQRVGMAVFPKVLDVLGLTDDKEQILKSVEENSQGQFIINALSEAPPQVTEAAMKMINAYKQSTLIQNSAAQKNRSQQGSAEPVPFAA